MKEIKKEELEQLGLSLDKGKYTVQDNKLYFLKDDTEGCILVGEKGVGRVNNSTPYEIKLTEILKEIQSKGETIEIEIV